MRGAVHQKVTTAACAAPRVYVSPASFPGRQDGRSTSSPPPLPTFTKPSTRAPLATNVSFDCISNRIEAYDKKGPQLRAIIAINRARSKIAAVFDWERTTKGDEVPRTTAHTASRILGLAFQ